MCRYKAEQWTSGHDADCGPTNTCENITFSLRSVITSTTYVASVNV